jgi:HSP20 family protein
MEFLKWDPFKDLVAIHERLNKLFEDTLAGSRRLEVEMLPTSWTPPVDVYETDNEIVLEAEVPGVDQNDIQVEVRENLLVLRGERRSGRIIDRENYHHRERSYGTFQRCFSLPKNIQPDQVRAKCREGVLEVIVPKAPLRTEDKLVIDIRTE